MLNREIKICKIITFSEEDFLAFNLEFSSSGVEVISGNIKEEIVDDGIPTLIVGWSNIKIIFPNQRISKRKIFDNVSWVYSVSEDKSTITETKTLIKSFISNWLPDTYITYDYVLDGALSKFLEKHFVKPYKLYLYFSGKAMYMFNSENTNKIIGVSLESMKYAGIETRKAVTAIIEKYSPICLSYSNVSVYLSDKHEPFFETIENLFWSRYFEEISEKYFYDFMMDVESDRFIPFIMYELYKKHKITEHEKIYISRLNKKDIITDWLSKRELFFDKKYQNEKLNLKNNSDGMPFVKLVYSNKRTITGRINCVDRRFNPQMLPKESPDRKQIVSRFKNGKLVVFDYVSFETKLSLFLSQNEEFIKEYKDKDLHEETAKVIFNKNSLNQNERMIGKSINHALIYGAGDEVLKRILKDSENKDEILEKVRNFLNPIIDFSKQIQNSCEDLGYIINSFGTIVKPQKTWATFSNFVSAMAADVLVDKLYLIREFLTNKKSKFIFQVHDSFIFDIHPDEEHIIEEIKNLLSQFKNISLQVEASEGRNLYECNLSEQEITELAI